MSVIVDFSMFPLDKGESLSSLVTRSLKIIDTSGLPYHLHAMGTSIEGEWDEVMEVVNRCYQEMSKHSNRVYLSLKADSRKGPLGRMQDKVAAVKPK